MTLPKEPNMLLSFINMNLRDKYSSLEDMCEDLDLSVEGLLEDFRNAGLIYDPATRQLKVK